MPCRHVPKLSGNGREDKEQRRGSPDTARDSGNGVRSRPGLEKRCTHSLKRESSFWSSAARRKEANRVGFENQIQKNERKVMKSGCELPTQRERAREGENHRQQSNTAWWLSWAKV
jgi:hypothetical protein